MDSSKRLVRLIEDSVRQGDHDQAAALLDEMIAPAAGDLVALEALANILQDDGLVVEAALLYRRLVVLCPHNADAHYNLGNLLRLQGKFDDAVTAFRKVLSLNEKDVEAHQQLGNVLHRLGRSDEAIAGFRTAIARNPDFHEAYVDLGNVLRSQGQFPEAISCYRRALEINPDYLLAQYNLGVGLMECGNLDEAIDCYRRVFTAAPHFVEARWNCAHCMLAKGEFDEGWTLFESRLEKASATMHRFSQPRWDGGSLRGKRILIHAEQGFGDTLQFVRYLALLKQERHAEHVFLVCQPELTRLLQCLPAVSQVIAGGIEPLPACDVQLPLLSLPLMFTTRLDSIPADVPYVTAPDQLVEHWKRRFAADARKKVGLAWAGRSTHPHDARRSLPPDAFLPLLERMDFCFVSLQKESARTDSPNNRLIDFTAELEDFADTAALISQLDLVITVDTAVAHLAGAMGKPVWLLNAFEGEWRWLLNRSDSPWYPGMTLFRQTQSGCWDDVLIRIAAGLDKMADKIKIKMETERESN